MRLSLPTAREVRWGADAASSLPTAWGGQVGAPMQRLSLPTAWGGQVGR